MLHMIPLPRGFATGEDAQEPPERVDNASYVAWSLTPSDRSASQYPG